MYKVCKEYQVESGHMLSKHKGACRFPHGHSRTISVVVESKTLNNNDMVIDFKDLKNIIIDSCEKYDHSMMVNAKDPMHNELANTYDNRIITTEKDPTTEFMANRIFCDIEESISSLGAKLHSVRVSETSSTWAQYSCD